jgi:hypothetical protein
VSSCLKDRGSFIAKRRTNNYKLIFSISSMRFT